MSEQQALQKTERDVVKEEIQRDEDLHHLEKWRMCRKQVCSFLGTGGGAAVSSGTSTQNDWGYVNIGSRSLCSFT
jgi:hypothetical protein